MCVSVRECVHVCAMAMGEGERERVCGQWAICLCDLGIGVRLRAFNLGAQNTCSRARMVG